jgi:hypothetical protein
MTECKQEAFTFTAHSSRRVEAGFTAGQVSTDGGALLLREVDGKINLLGRLAGCFSDGRSPLLVKHQLPEMLAQRIYGLALSFEPSLAEMFAQYLQYSSIRAEFVINRDNFRHRTALGGLEDGVQAIGIRFIGTEHAKVSRIYSEDIPKEIPKLARSLGQNLTRSGNLERIIREVGQSKCNEFPSAIYMGIASHATIADGREGRQFIDKFPFSSKSSCGL